MIVAVVFGALLSSTPSGCLELMAADHAAKERTEPPTFRTELECELWQTTVDLEGDVRTATTTLEEKDATIEELLRRRPVVLEVRVPVPAEPVRSLLEAFAMLASAAVGAGTGAFVGYEVARDRPLPLLVGAAAGAITGCVLADLVF